MEGKTDSKGSETGSNQESSVDIRPYGARLALAQLTWCYKSGETLVPLAAFQTDWLLFSLKRKINQQHLQPAVLQAAVGSKSSSAPSCCGWLERLQARVWKSTAELLIPQECQQLFQITEQ